ncbi:MAG: CCA-adding enzyme [halophilic archaeon J07HX5]|nr:MAG: CCA-adding enzyme [halophilic archaeon J07HX5]
MDRPAFEAVTEGVRDRIVPDPAERDRLEAAVETLTSRAEQAVTKLPVGARIVQAGSTARDTWLSGDRDIDIFVCFPPELDDGTLEEHGIAVGYAVLPDGREEYAEHPYVSGEYDGFDVDLVPCFDVASATDIRSSVDRTPFHTAYVRGQINTELANQVRLCKQFALATGVYGSDLRTRGFSGYLTELLVVEHGGFRPLIAAAADWDPPVRLDPAEHGQTTFGDPLVVVDPTDPERNVAAVLSTENLARFQHAARALAADPRPRLFESVAPDPVDATTVRAAFERRGTTPTAVRVTVPALVDDQLWPQLERSRSGVAGLLGRHGFEVFRDAVLAEDHVPGCDDRTAVLLFELAVAKRPAVERHEGPPVAAQPHADRFYDTYSDTDAAGPFVVGDRYAVERAREHADAASLLDAKLLEASHGAQVRRALAKEYDLLVGDEVGVLADRFGTELAVYLDPTVRQPR